MYSQAGDLVLDPFLGLGTTTKAAMILGRNSIGCEIDDGLRSNIELNIRSLNVDTINKSIASRFKQHQQFVEDYSSRKGPLKHYNAYFECPVVTSQEETMELHFITGINHSESEKNCYICSYEDCSDMANLPHTYGSLLF